MVDGDGECSEVEIERAETRGLGEVVAGFDAAVPSFHLVGNLRASLREGCEDHHDRAARSDGE